LARAESDFRVISIVLQSPAPPFDAVCFHAQQGAEKCLKALLTFLGVTFGRTHDLPKLAALLPPGSPLPETLGDLSELADAAVSARYPDDLSCMMPPPQNAWRSRPSMRAASLKRNCAAWA